MSDAPARPPRPSRRRPSGFDADRVPEVLRSQRRWLCWQYRWNGKKWTKPPLSAHGGPGSSTDASTWATLDEALEFWRANDDIDGIGFALDPTTGIVGIDFDRCMDANGRPNEHVQRWIDRHGSYAERSPSGEGVRVFVRAKKPVDSRCKVNDVLGCEAVEAYADGRYLTVTSEHLEGTPLQIVEAQEAFDEFIAGVMTPKAESDREEATRDEAVDADGGAGSWFDDGVGYRGSDDDLIAAARKAKNGDKFCALFDRGDTSGHQNDDSVADLALCVMIAFWTGPDAARIDRIFRRSKLFRDKWDRQWGTSTYGARTIEKALGMCETYLGAEKRDGKADDDDDLRLGQIDPETKRLILSTRRTLPTSRAYIKEFHTHRDGETLVSFANELYEWRRNCFRKIAEEAVQGRVLPWLHKAVTPVISLKTGEATLIDFPANPKSVSDAIKSIRGQVHVSEATPMPSWRGKEGPYPAHEILVGRTSNLHIPTRTVVPVTPALFTTNALDFDYDANAPEPTRFLEFVDEVFDDDVEAVEFVQEFCGYVVSSDTSQQKIGFLCGPRRGGKGTLARILRAMVGVVNVCAPTMSSLAGPFGMQPLIGKSLATVSDARFTGPHISIAVERLLNISGEDTVTIDRKHLPSVTMKLPTRFLFLSNELPQFSDASKALVGRFIVVRLTKSFYGREDPALTDKLLLELPGILNWSLAGLERLRERGHFIQPGSGVDSATQMEELASPMSAFIQDHCIVEPGRRVDCDRLFEVWCFWCKRKGRKPGDAQSFGRDLHACKPTVIRRRGTRDSFYDGIGLLEPGQ